MQTNKWTSQAGPRMTKSVEQALKELLRAGAGTLHLSNSADGTEFQSVQYMFGQDTPEEAAHRLKREQAFNDLHVRYSGTITAENYKSIIADCQTEAARLTACRPVKDERKTQEQHAEERSRVWAAQELRDLERAEAAKKEEAESAALRTRYPYLLPNDAPGNIRILLKRNFPGVKFSVRSDYSSVRIKWNNGPTEKAVEEITSPFKAGHFDGMTDCYEYRRDAFGGAFGTAQYIFTSREIDPGLRAAIEAACIRPANLEGWELEQFVNRQCRELISKTALTGKGAFKGVVYEADEYALAFEEGAGQTVPAAAPIECGAVRIEEHTHTKKNFQMWIVILAARVEREEFDALTSRAKAAGGWYSRAWGSTPGGWAFKDKGAAETFAASIGGGETPPDGTEGRAQGRDASGAFNIPAADRPEVIPSNLNLRVGYARTKADSLRSLAAGLTAKIEEGRRPLSQNPTPKRTLQYRARCLESDDLERCQQAMTALADGWEAGTLPPILQTYTTKAGILAAVQTVKSHPSYYTITDTGKFRDSSPAAVALQALLSGPDPERVREQTVKNKILDIAGCKIEGFFPTPAAVVERMIEEADIKPGETVLEPSAGTGNIADAAKAAGGVVHCIELRHSLCEILTLKGHKVEQGDFMEAAAGAYDKALLNPPFERGQDADHIRRAYRYVKPGGRLVAICSEGLFFRADGADFRSWLDSVGGWSERLPEGSFKGTGEISTTGTAARIVIIHK
jgi:hypothetical protein